MKEDKSSIPQIYMTHWNTSDQLKLILAKWAEISDGSPVVNTYKAEPMKENEPSKKDHIHISTRTLKHEGKKINILT